jgi:organic hydroperoxide reductase OsmC/OhrA
MHPYPHTYQASAAADATSLVSLTSPQLPAIESAPPPEFDGPGGKWSPETLLCASLADCFILTFRAIARLQKLPWQHLECRLEGVLERVERVAQFTRFTTTAVLRVPAGTNEAAARDAMERAEHGCLIANSLRATRTLNAQVIIEA